MLITRRTLRSIRTASCFIGASLFGCTYTRVAPGHSAETSGSALDEQLARVAFYSQSGVSLSGMSIDGVSQSFFDSGFEVSPGEHRFFAVFRITGPGCSASGGRCEGGEAEGTCSGTLRANSGAEYEIRVTPAGTDAFVSVTTGGNEEYAGAGSCTTRRVSYLR